MMETTNGKRFALWTKDRNERVTCDPTLFTSAHAAITEGERQVAKRSITDYNYVVVHCPMIGGEVVQNKVLTSEGRGPSIEL